MSETEIERKNSLELEAEAFSRVALERVANGQIPDLRRVEACDWFYNNSWRRPHLVDKEFGRNIRFTMSHFRTGSVLELGSGPGHMSLELARNGYRVTGLELAPGAVEVARRIAEENPFTVGFGSLQYVVADFLTWESPEKFDNICMYGALHHFEDVEGVVDRVAELLAPGGRVVVIEPARDWFDEKDGAIVALIRFLQSASGAWFEPLALPSRPEEIRDYAVKCVDEYTEAHSDEEAEQSPHDNSAFAEQMLSALRRRFRETELRPGYSFFYRVGGGLRGGSEEQVRGIAEFLHAFDQYAVSTGLMHASEFLWAGTFTE